jgi:hypothetical protein
MGEGGMSAEILLEGIPLPPTRTSSLFAEMEALAKYLGIDADYDYLKGVCGRAFDLHVHPTGVYCEGPEECDTAHTGRAFHLIGCSHRDNITIREDHPLNDPQAWEEAVRSSLCTGVPVLAVTPFFPRWGLIAGCDSEGRFLVVDPEGHQVHREFSDGFIVVVTKSGPQPDRRQVIRDSFRLLVDQAYQETATVFWSTPENPHVMCGLAAYDCWIRHLRNGGKLEASGWCYVDLVDSRRSAVAYLKMAESVVDADQRECVAELRATFAAIHEHLAENRPLFDEKPKTAPVRLRQADALERAKTMENRAYEVMKSLVA